MTVLILDRMWVNRMDTGEGISAYSTPERGTSHEMDGDDRKYASGRFRSIATAGTKTLITRTLVPLSLATKDKLVSWEGVNVQVRDVRGQRWFGVFYAVDVREDATPGVYAATLTLQTTTTVEGV